MSTFYMNYNEVLQNNSHILENISVGFLLTMLIQILLLLNASTFKKNQDIAYITLILVVSSLLSISAVFAGHLIPKLILTLLTLGAFYIILKTKFEISRLFPLKLTKSGYFALLPLLILLLFTGLPLYKADQWTAYLLVSKIISFSGKLTLPIFNDHIYFGGVYDYIYLFPRLFTNNDITINSFAHIFGLSSYTIALFLIISKLFHTQTFSIRVVLTAFVVFATPDIGTIYSSKGDWINIIAPLVLARVLFLKKANSKQTAFLLGFLIIAPLAIKFTWLLYVLAISVALIILQIKQRFKHIYFILLGGGAGLLICFPFFVKNYIFFDNLIHPAQIELFSFLNSSYWNEKMTVYWKANNAPAQDFATYLYYVLLSTLQSMKSLMWFILPTLLLFIHQRFTTKKNTSFYRSPTLIYLLIAIFAFILIWPLLFRPTIFVRFVYALTGLTIGAVLIIIKKYEFYKSKYFTAALLIPVVLHSQTEVSLRDISNHLFQTTHEFYKTSPKIHALVESYALINKHRQTHFPNSLRNNNILLTDSNYSYFFDGSQIYEPGYEQEWFWENNHTLKCPFSFAKAMDIRYLFLKEDFYLKNNELGEQWQPRYSSLIKVSTPLYGSAYIRYLSKETIAQKSQEEIQSGCNL